MCSTKPKANIHAILPEEQIRPALPLTMEWNATFCFPPSVTLNPQTLDVFGLFNIRDGCVQSVSTVCSSFDKTPDTRFFE
jgi:hypothetical protein